MKKLLFIYLFIGFHVSLAQTLLWSEDFVGEVNGAITGTAAGTPGGTWSVTTAPSGTFSRQNNPTIGFLASSTVSEGVWQTNVIDISGVVEVGVDGTLTSFVFGPASDYMRLFYKVNGGPEVQFAEYLGTNSSTSVTYNSPSLSGASLQIVMRSNTNTAPIFLSNLAVNSLATLYSIASASWGTNGTWSTTGFGGISCSCTPNANTRVIVGNNRTVSLSATGTAASLDIQSTGILQYSAANAVLNISKANITVFSGGALNRNGQTGVQISFNASSNQNFVIDGSTSTQDILFTQRNTMTISGTNTLTLSGQIQFNNGSGTSFTTLVNTGTIVASGDIIDNSLPGNSVINNSSGASLSFSNLDPQGTPFQVNNSGTINQSADFLNTVGGVIITNLSGSVWNFGGGGSVAGVSLFCNNGTNTFNYNRAGTQNVITPQDNYSNITLSGSGAKSALASFSVKGNWSLNGTASYTPGLFTVTFNGSAAQTIGGTISTSFYGLTINNTFGTIPQIILGINTTATNRLTMTAGVVNLALFSFTISSNTTGSLSHSLASSAGWMYGGNFVRAVRTGAITLLNVDGFFPMGTSIDFRPFFIGKTNNGSSAGNITMSHTGTAGSSVVSIVDGTTIIKQDNAFWTMSTSGSAAGATYGIRYGGTGLGTVTNLSHLHSCLSASVIATHVAATTVSLTDPRVERSGLTHANLTNSFYVGSDNIASPLPIELVNFNALLKANGVELSWTTASELNNDFFTIERSDTGKKFDIVKTVKGNGTTNLTLHYQDVDENPLPETSYYWLKQTDFDGKFSYSEVRTIENNNPVSPFKVYPNPIVNNKFVVEMNGLPSNAEVPLSIINMQGAIVHQGGYQADINGSLKASVELNAVPSGVYMVVVNAATGLRKKIVIP